MSDETFFHGETWQQLIPFLEQLPEAVKLVVWGDPDGGRFEQEALQLGRALAERFDILHFEQRPRQPTYPYYPIFGVMGVGAEEIDYRVRLIGLPAGYQINSLVGAIQAVSFRASNLEPRTRIQLSRLPAAAQIDLELFTAAEDESGPLVASLAAGLAVASPKVRTFIVMVDVFPQALVRYSIRQLPHTVINGRVHIAGVVDEPTMLQHIARSLQ